MAVTEADVMRIADLARLGMDPERVDSLVHELNGILEHMNVLQAVDTGSVVSGQEGETRGMPLRADVGPRYPLARPLADFAPSSRDGFLLVPRLTTHEHLEGSDDGEGME